MRQKESVGKAVNWYLRFIASYRCKFYYQNVKARIMGFIGSSTWFFKVQVDCINRTDAFQSSYSISFVTCWYVSKWNGETPLNNWLLFNSEIRVEK